MTKDLVYHEHLTPYTREELVEKIHTQLKKPRFEHVLRVEQVAMELAKENDADVERASIAGLCHDYAKQRPDADFITAIKAYHMDPDLLNYGNAIWHGLVGAELVRRELLIDDEEILNAIRYHTTGAPYMTTLEQIIYMADYIDPKRDFDGVEQARQLSHEDLPKAVAYQTKRTLAYLIAKNAPVYPATLTTYNAWVPQYSDL
ncbi:bis(5'-nucleosyl)-tetraphosphatase (symmetrical) YqeK [Levilactobacillus bambusae]|uniref:bis(5'-nucleosyl)-tetraphosphatase (symmetrical) n=1 Tax=Levilactobacillus bambusae TaxID=2024736 RepID=A0A2V1N1C9_9LACO|nr:bis(5'-nucleosyl)-tetraphosphatase (symmetrical) YqeK [Levilactobacillus bambusae]PWG01024.1 HD domain-containing protein [Levilactobacillus bambusae]